MSNPMQVGRNVAKKILTYSKRGLHLADLDPISSWFYSVINRQSHRNLLFTGKPQVNYYEFGVGIRTLGRYLSTLRLFCERTGYAMDDFHVYAFDSFQGLPTKKDEKDNYLEWKEGSFRTTLSVLKKQLNSLGFNPDAPNLHYVSGYYETTLTKNLQNDLKSRSPSIVTVDVDYYSSTIQVLNWLKPILKSGVIFYFDDIWAFDGNPYYGQPAAIHQFNKRRDGGLLAYPEFGMDGCAYIYWKRKFNESSSKSDLRKMRIT
ncbi:MAG: TylF/MycF/NovP-related O-methyltransferase [Candidatus Bathyarchaeia archaeon]